MFMINHNIDFNFQSVDFVNNKEDAQFVKEKTPINRVPVLFQNETAIFESRVILNTLTENHKIQKLTPKEENYLSVINSCTDAGVTLFLMRRDGFDMEKKSFFLERTKNRIPEGLKYLREWEKKLNPNNPSDWSIPAMSLYSFLYWAHQRELIDLNQYPDEISFIENFKSSKGVSETSF
tara:strand:- start:283 stop:819 length:537 start_codon:yes stop_codon:yes gene_type:complete